VGPVVTTTHAIFFPVRALIRRQKPDSMSLMRKNTRNQLFATSFVLALVLGCAPGVDETGDAATRTADAVPTVITNPAPAGSGQPNLAAGAGGTFHLSWLVQAGEAHSLRSATLSPDGATWSAPGTAGTADTVFANWADFPSVTELADGSLVAHWLQYLAPGKYSYGVLLARTTDGEWSEPWQPHDDSSPVEHGFVSVVAEPAGGFTAIWLDGRAFIDSDDAIATNEMSVRARRYDADGTADDEQALDLLVCDCCQTGAAMIGDVLVVAYRNRSPEEIRDIWTVRRTADGWSEPAAVANDGWMIPGCPVNGPMVVATTANSGAVAWFALVNDLPEVKVAFTHDSGASFDDPILIERGTTESATLGRVGMASLGDGSVVVSWLTQRDNVGEIRYQRIAPDGAAGVVRVLATTGAARDSGFPRLAASNSHLLLAWTDTLGDTPAIRTARLPLTALTDGS